MVSPLRRLVIYFALFALITPLFHTHALTFGKVHLSAAAKAAAHSPQAPAYSSGSGESLSVSTTADLGGPEDCLLCQWLTHTHTAATPEAFLLLIVTTEALLLLHVRFVALCARPTPQRGLRAPPVSFLTA